MEILVSHATGNQNVRALCSALLRQNALGGFYTTVAFPNGEWGGFIPRSLRQELVRRTYPLPKGKVKSAFLRETIRILATRLGLRKWVVGDRAPFSNFSVGRHLDSSCARSLRVSDNISGVYCYDDTAEATFRRARQLEKKCFYECPTSHWKTWLPLFAEEAELEPEWAATLSVNGISQEKIDRKQAEFELADLVVCPSSFSKKSIAKQLPITKEIVVVPYGSPVLASEATEMCEKKSGEEKLRVIYVGGMTQKKGLSYLSKAVSHLDNLIELRLVGHANTGQCPALDRFLSDHTWHASLPHSEVLALMRQSDVLVLPSLSDGFGLVILEAMSCGLPVIATENTGGPDVIVNGENGFVVPIRSSEEIEKCLALLASDRELLEHMKQKARNTAKVFSWERYGETMIDLLRSKTS